MTRFQSSYRELENKLNSTNEIGCKWLNKTTCIDRKSILFKDKMNYR